MSSPRFLVAAALFGMLLPGFSDAQTFVVRDRNATVTNTNIKDDDPSAGGANLAAGDSISFQGNIDVSGSIAVEFDPVESGLTLSVESGSTIIGDGPGFGFAPPNFFDGRFTNNGTINSRFSSGVVFGTTVTGSLINYGTILGSTDGVAILGDLAGSIINWGTIDSSSGFRDGVFIQDNLTGLLVNSGSISGLRDGVFVGAFATGVFRNSGTISGNRDGVFIFDDLTGSFENSGTITARFRDGVSMFSLAGSLVNTGTITAGEDGVEVANDVTGSFVNSGTITGEFDGVFIIDDLEGTFENTGTITGLVEEGVEVGDSFRGTFVNWGTIMGDEEGVQFGQDFFANSQEFTGTLINYGTIIGTDDSIDVENLSAGGRIINRGTLIGGDDAFDANNDFGGRFENYSIMRGASDGFDIDGVFSGVIFNCGIIEAGEFGLSISTDPGFLGTGTGTFHNHGGRLQGGRGAISFGQGNGTVLLSGPSHIIGSIDGGAGTGDVLRFQDMRGISAEKEAELVALAANDPNAGTVTLFGESITWLNIEDIQADGSTLESYEGLFAGTGLGGYGNALDNLNGLNDSLREFLKALNDVPLSELNRTASNSSGQTLRNSMADLRRERDVNFYHLFSNQFSSLRGEVSGGDPNLAVRSEGFFSREVEIGATVQLPDAEVDTWVTSYVGSGNQGSNSVRQGADYDQSTILFGRGEEWGADNWIGWFGGYSRSEGRVDSFGSSLENDGGWFGLNAQFRRGDAFATLVGGVGFQDIMTNRIDFLGSTHEGNTEAFGAFLYSQIGKDFAFGEEGRGKWTPYAGFSLGGDYISGYDENGPAASALRFQDDSETVFQTVLGVSASGYGETKKGWFRPRADLAWWHSYGEDSFGASLANTTLLNAFSVSNPDANVNRGLVQVGLEFGLDCLEDWTFELGYFGIVGEDDYSSHGGTVGARVEF